MKKFVRKTIRAISILVAMASFWMPFFVYIVTRSVGVSIVALTASIALMCVCGIFVENCDKKGTDK